MSEEDLDELLEGRHTMALATMLPDGRIHQSAVYYARVDGRVCIWSFRKAQRVANLRRDPRVSAMVEAGDNYAELRGVSMSGTATIVEDHDEVMRVGRVLFTRYAGAESPELLAAADATSEKRVLLVLDITHTVTWDHRKLGGTY